MDDLNRLWAYIENYFQEELSKPSFETWFQELKPARFEQDTLYLLAGSKLHKRHIETHYLVQIRQVAYDFLKRDINVELILADEEPDNLSFGSPTQATKSHNNRFSSRSTQLNPKYTFDNFIVGEGNKMAHAAALAVAEGPGHDYNPLFFYGGVGLGKTHLMQAIGHEVTRLHPEARVKYVTSETFTNDFIEAIRTNTMPDFHAEYRQVDMLLVDDIQFIAEGNKDKTQEEFFHTFNELYNNNKHIVLTSDRDAGQIPQLEDRLVSRFKQGLSTDITPPDLETRIAILRNKAQTNQLDIPDNTLNYIAGQIDSNVRELEGALTSVQAYVVMHHAELTPSVAAQALRNYTEQTQDDTPTVASIQETVANFYHLTVADLKGKKRKREIVLPRQIAMYLARELTDLSRPKIGRKFGGKDHTTVLHAHDKITKEMKNSISLENDLGQIKKLLQNMF